MSICLMCGSSNFADSSTCSKCSSKIFTTATEQQHAEFINETGRRNVYLTNTGNPFINDVKASDITPAMLPFKIGSFYNNKNAFRYIRQNRTTNKLK